ncbi:MAG: DNA alkylation repair protein [Candidatus Omnitrophota bacterium]
MHEKTLSLRSARAALHSHKSKKKAKILQSFFKTGKGQYAEGDLFIGVTVPVIRGLAKRFAELALRDAVLLLRSAIHEERLLALLILIRQYDRGTARVQKRIYRAYLANIDKINNWDLVDVTAERVVGRYLFDKDKKPLYMLAYSRNLWERRIAILSTFHYIKQGLFGETLAIAGILLRDKEDLIHKAVGWMLREVGKRDRAAEERFLKGRYKTMPRTMLRYAIEKFPETRRRAYLKGRI